MNPDMTMFELGILAGVIASVIIWAAWAAYERHVLEGVLRRRQVR